MENKSITKDCMFRFMCKKWNGEECNKLCYPFIMLHGQKGDTGFWRATGVPAKYKGIVVQNLPIREDNKEAYKTIERYVSKIEEVVEYKGLGLFLFSRPSAENRLGTGTGKTTSAVAILHEYVLSSVRRHLKKERKLKDNPALFIKGSEFQNIYNAQFRGNSELQKEASDSFYKFKSRMKQVSLLVIDDIGIRDTTEAFKNELFEIIDYRCTEELATIVTANMPPAKIYELLGERIASRLEGMTVPVEFKGKDHRKGNF